MTVDASTDPLSYAASLLDAVGADFDQVPAEVIVDCLYAADRLELAGARPEPIALVDGDPRATLRAAMTVIGGLNGDVFAAPQVLDAARAARHALRRLG